MAERNKGVEAGVVFGVAGFVRRCGTVMLYHWGGVACRLAQHKSRRSIVLELTGHSTTCPKVRSWIHRFADGGVWMREGSVGLEVRGN